MNLTPAGNPREVILPLRAANRCISVKIGLSKGISECVATVVSTCGKYVYPDYRFWVLYGKHIKNKKRETNRKEREEEGF